MEEEEAFLVFLVELQVGEAFPFHLEVGAFPFHLEVEAFLFHLEVGAFPFHLEEVAYPYLEELAFPVVVVT